MAFFVTAAAWVALGATLVAIWGVVTQRIIARRKATIDYLLRADTDNDLIDARDVFIRLTSDAGGLARWAEPLSIRPRQRRSASL